MMLTLAAIATLTACFGGGGDEAQPDTPVADPASQESESTAAEDPAASGTPGSDATSATTSGDGDAQGQPADRPEPAGSGEPGEPDEPDEPDEQPTDSREEGPARATTSEPIDLVAVLAELEALKQRGEFTQARAQAEDYAARTDDPEAKEALRALIRDYRHLARRAMKLRVAVDNLGAGRVEAQHAKIALLDGGEAGRILLLKAARTGDPQTVVHAVEVLTALGETAAFPVMVERYVQNPDASQQLRTKLVDAMAAMSDRVEPAALQQALEHVRSDTGFANRGLVDVLFAVGDAESLDETVGAGANDLLVAYVERAYEADDAELKTWSLQHASRAGLGASGLTATVWAEAENFSGEPLTRTVVDAVAFDKGDERPDFPGGLDEKFSMRLSADFIPPASGTYRFTIISDDGSKLYIGDTEVADNSGYHGMEEASGTIELEAGVLYPLRLDYYQGGGGAGLVARVSGPELPEQILSGKLVRTQPVQ
ncbi:MAG: PA14 domain-containing protein [Planctomycetota bacterium]